jgi:hypothetical protein
VDEQSSGGGEGGLIYEAERYEERMDRREIMEIFFVYEKGNIFGLEIGSWDLIYPAHLRSRFFAAHPWSGVCPSVEQARPSYRLEPEFLITYASTTFTMNATRFPMPRWMGGRIYRNA